MSEIQASIEAVIHDVLVATMREIWGSLSYGGVIKKLQVEPGDVLCIFSQPKLSEDEKQNIFQTISSTFRNGKCLVFDDGLDIRVLHSEELDESEVIDG